MITHYGNPCVHCSVPHDKVKSGDCKGDRSKAVPLQYWIKRYAMHSTNNADEVRIKLSTGEIIEQGMFSYQYYTEYFSKAQIVERGVF